MLRNLARSAASSRHQPRSCHQSSSSSSTSAFSCHKMMYHQHHHHGGSVLTTAASAAGASATTTTMTTPVPRPPYFRHQTQRFKGAFVSCHNVSLNVSAPIILEYCQSHGLSQVKQTPTHVVIRECPFCTKPTDGKLSNLYKLYVESSSGAYFCHRCGAKGSWYDFKAQLNGGYYTSSTAMSSSSSSSSSSPATTSTRSHGGWTGGGGARAGAGDEGGWGGPRSMMDDDSSPPRPHRHSHQHASRSSTTNAEPPLPMPQARLSGFYSSLLLDKNNDDHTNDALQYLLNQRGLNRATLRKYGVGRATYQFPGDKGYVKADCITFPWIMKESQVQMQESLRGAEYVPPVRVAAAAIPPRQHDSSSSSSSASTTQTAAAAAAASATAAVETSANEKTATTTTTTADNSNDAAPVSTPTSIDTPDDPFVTRRIKARAVQEKAWQRLDPAGGGWGLFGLHTVPDDATEIVLTEGEYDAMAVAQATGRPAVSLPNGCRSLPVPVLPLLERFDKIYLWMDNDLPGQEGAEQFAKKLGLNRCYIVQCRDAKDANEALLQGLDLSQYLDQAKLVPHDRLLTFADLRSEVLHELLEPDLYKGAAVPSLPQFTNLIKGFRRGEMTVLTGPTGSGKTTFLGQVSLDLAEQGMNVLWGSFEVKNSRLLHKLLKQFSRKPLPDIKDPNVKEILNALADRFESLPLHFLRFHGGSDIDEVLDAMEYAVYVNDTEHIILDNMQFMISRGKTKGGSWEKFDVQDVAIEKFRKFATEHNVHVTLVVHPRKEDESAKLNISSFYGSAKATQEADTVLILQHDGRRKYVEVKKNRFDGTLGIAPLYFESKSGRYVETEGGALKNEGSTGKQPHSIAFVPAQQQYPQWMSRRKEPEPEPENLDSHFDSMLTVPEDIPEEDKKWW